MRNVLVALTAILFLIPALAAANEPPVADAGPDQEVFVNATAYLFGSATDPDGDPIVEWLWAIDSQPAGSDPNLSLPIVPSVTFSADMAGEYVVSLVASDGELWSDPDTLTITVRDILPPVAIATADVTVGPLPLTVHFDGSQSYSPQGDELTYSWNFGGSPPWPPYSDEVSPTYTYEWRSGAFIASLIVRDSRGQTDSDEIFIRVYDPDECKDGIDNDHDGLTDFPEDGGCISPPTVQSATYPRGT